MPRLPTRAAPGWAVQSVPAPIVANGQLWAVSCTSATACTAVGGNNNSAGAALALAERWNGSSWSIQSTPNPAGAAGSSFSGVSCTSATACTAAGNYTTGTGTQVTLAERWNGSSWSIQSTPNPAGAAGSALSGVSCPSATACTAVGGYSNSAGTGLTLAERWNGTSWTIQSTPNPPGAAGSSLSGVSCPTVTACTAAGSSSAPSSIRSLAERWNGTSWTIQATPNPGGSAPNLLNGVWCTSAAACTAVGGYVDSSSILVTLAERWNGSSWSVQATPNRPGAKPSGLNAVTCSSAAACTAVGASTQAFGPPDPLAERWNGTSWTIQATPSLGGTGVPSSLQGVSCPTATACTAVGYSFSPGQPMLAERWNGTTWTLQATPSPAGATGKGLSAVSCPSATACTAVGYYTNSSGATLALAERWNGTTWTLQATRTPVGAQGSTLSGVSCTSATACTAAGYYANSSGATLALAERWNGTTWTLQATPSPVGAQGSTLSGVSCTSATACTAAGYYTNSSGKVVTLAERWNGTTWTVQATPNPTGPPSDTFVLNGISCTSATACTAAGDTTDHDGNQVTLAESWNGTTWTLQATPSPGRSAALNGVSCTSATACTAAGSFASTGASMPLAERYS